MFLLVSSWQNEKLPLVATLEQTLWVSPWKMPCDAHDMMIRFQTVRDCSGALVWAKFAVTGHSLFMWCRHMNVPDRPRFSLVS